jgi:hypothetical protein
LVAATHARRRNHPWRLDRCQLRPPVNQILARAPQLDGWELHLQRNVRHYRHVMPLQQTMPYSTSKRTMDCVSLFMLSDRRQA